LTYARRSSGRPHSSKRAQRGVDELDGVGVGAVVLAGDGLLDLALVDREAVLGVLAAAVLGEREPQIVGAAALGGPLPRRVDIALPEQDPHELGDGSAAQRPVAWRAPLRGWGLQQFERFLATTRPLADCLGVVSELAVAL
jgi:hypothetical protein